MTKGNTTKVIYANTLKKLLKEYSLEKVCVKDITARCGLSRNSFYYHFSDKYELVNWIFSVDITDKLKLSYDSSNFMEESFINICEKLYQDRTFYQACFKYEGQNSLFETLYNIYYKMWESKLYTQYRTKKSEISEEEIVLIAKSNTVAVIGMFKDWIRSGMKDDYISYFKTHQFAKRQCYIFAGKYIMVL